MVIANKSASITNKLKDLHFKFHQFSSSSISSIFNIICMLFLSFLFLFYIKKITIYASEIPRNHRRSPVENTGLTCQLLMWNLKGIHVGPTGAGKSSVASHNWMDIRWPIIRHFRQERIEKKNGASRNWKLVFIKFSHIKRIWFTTIFDFFFFFLEWRKKERVLNLHFDNFTTGIE